MKQLKKLSQNFFIFGDYVYQLDPVIAGHPGGMKIAQLAKGKEVDRYLFGVEPIEGAE